MDEMIKTSGRRAELNRDKILRASLALFQGSGIRKVTMSEIARKADLSPATVYNHFGTKEALVRATIQHYLDTIMKEYERIIHSNLSFLQQIEQMIVFESEMFRRDQGELLLEIASDDPATRDLIDTFYMNANRQLIVDFFEDGKKQGYVNPDVSPDTIILYSDIIRRGMMAEPGINEDPVYFRKVLEEITPLYLYGLLGKPGNEQAQVRNE